MDFIMDNYIIVTVVGALVLFAIIGYLIDSSKKSKNAKGQIQTEPEVAAETPEIAMAEEVPMTIAEGPVPMAPVEPAPVAPEVIEPAVANVAPAIEEAPAPDIAAVSSADMFVPADAPAEEAPVEPPAV